MSQSKWIALVVAEIIALCCCAGLFGVILYGNSTNPSSTPSLVALASATRTVRATGAPQTSSTPEVTLTVVFPPRTAPATLPRITPGAQTPTRASTITATAYNIIVPTPTAPRLIYPITFNDTLVVMTYPVSGKTVDELHKSLDASALPDPHEQGNRYYARTDWLFSAHWLWKDTPNGCEVDRGDVSIAMTMTLPVLATTAGLSADVLSRWNTFIQNTQTHETGHVKLAQQGARDYQRDLGNSAPASNCDVMPARLKELFDKSSTAIDTANVSYDTQTQHGFTQGAVFP